MGLNNLQLIRFRWVNDWCNSLPLEPLKWNVILWVKGSKGQSQQNHLQPHFFLPRVEAHRERKSSRSRSVLAAKASNLRGVIMTGRRSLGCWERMWTVGWIPSKSLLLKGVLKNAYITQTCAFLGLLWQVCVLSSSWATGFRESNETDHFPGPFRRKRSKSRQGVWNIRKK